MVIASHELSHEISGGFRSNGSPSHPRGFFEKILLDSLDENWGTMLGNQKKKRSDESTLCHKISPFFTLW